MDPVKKQEYKKPEIVELSAATGTAGMTTAKGTSQNEGTNGNAPFSRNIIAS